MINSTGILNAIVSHAMGLGIFERVNTSEPKNNPGNGLTAAIWVQHIGPVAAISGLASTTARIEFTIRLYTNMLAEPQDDIDPVMLEAVDELLNVYSSDFDLGGMVRNVDLLGAHGNGLSAQAGYINQGGTLYRVMDVVLPVIINDVWEQVV
jgi:hypothetical protein